jgi:hypothetical protein
MPCMDLCVSERLVAFARTARVGRRRHRLVIAACQVPGLVNGEPCCVSRADFSVRDFLVPANLIYKADSVGCLANGFFG